MANPYSEQLVTARATRDALDRFIAGATAAGLPYAVRAGAADAVRAAREQLKQLDAQINHLIRLEADWKRCH